MARLGSSSNIDRWLSQWRARVEKFENKLSATPLQAAQYGAAFAKTIAPRDTGSLIQAISSARVGSKQRGSGKAKIWVRSNPANPKRRGLHAKPNYYSLQHHSHTRRWKYSPKTGDGRFLFTTRKKLSSKFRQDVLIAVEDFTGVSRTK